MRNNNHPVSNLAVRRVFSVRLAFTILSTAMRSSQKVESMRTLRYEVHVDPSL